METKHEEEFIEGDTKNQKFPHLRPFFYVCLVHDTNVYPVNQVPV